MSSAFGNRGSDQSYSKDLFGSSYQNNFDIFKNQDNQQSRFSSLKARTLDSADRSSDDINNSANTSTSQAYSPNRRIPSRNQSFDLSFDSPNPSLAVINQKTNAAQQQTQPLWFNNPRRRAIPSHAVKRETISDIDNESTSFLNKNKQSSNSNPGFKTLTFGTRRNTAQLAHVQAFSDELPPSRTISDLKRDDLSEGHLSFANDTTNGNASLISNNHNAFKDSNKSISLSNSGTPLKYSQNFLPSHLSDSAFSTPSKSLDSPQAISSSPLRTDSESAVLVFGYPESIANSVIKHFAKFGKILEDFEVTRVDPLFTQQKTKTYPIYTGDGWVKLTYDNKASAMRALEESGTVFHGSMIGCVPYSKQAIENIASISINNNDNIGESDLVQQKQNTMQVDGLPNYSNNLQQRIQAKNDDQIFVKPTTKDTKGIYSKRREIKPDGNDNLNILSKVSNWFFGWEDL
ncbi:Nucleoporin [Wickerhamomyces ciferrii]|uniref:Nucleoporin n=1 Tax=Wickerhamomyces ciferrii (strain ATCC 14091 / BCRC 22168 / CBS 111 / JCM 3599 / NBRC 0793 / NRRL Y-1031 F-60-10) TaxID=1206466 RepID=K0KBB1_WICCF|nr:Nucleoporin [Wickerhamomyces ciferrii]CCH42280.1 Nucleoporin [Wickerhamomyces ciferrii]